MKRIVSTLLAALLPAAALWGCGVAQGQPTVPADPAGGDGAALRVVTTIFPPYDFVRAVAGDRVELHMLLSPGAESHSYDPTPQDIIAIQESDLFLYVGGDTDIWVERILESMDTAHMTRMPLMELVDAVEEELVEGMEHGDGDEHDHDGDHDNGEEEPAFDEHVWTDPQNAATIVGAIADTLCGLDPVNGDFYRENAKRYTAELAALDADFREMADGAVRNTIIFGDRFPFRYLADAYSLRYYAAFPGCSTETEPSAATVAFLIDKVRDEKIPVVFHIELSNQRMADAICESTGAKKLLLHSCHNVTRDDFEGGETYLTLMRRNLDHLKEALY